MSFKYLDKCFALNGFHPTRKLVLLALADSAGENGDISADIDSLLRRSGVSETDFWASIGEFSTGGLIKVSLDFALTPDEM